MARKSISNKIRFEVFKRDSFTCQYCGKKAPDVVLNVDHIKPVAKGGTNDMFNLITSCFECNNGKRDIPLNRQEELDKQRESLEMLEEWRKQIDMLYKWKTELSSLKDYALQKVLDFLHEQYGIGLSEHGEKNLKKWIKEFGIDEVLEVIPISFEQYEEEEKAFNYIPRICYVRQEQKANPLYRDIYYLSKILEANCTYYDKKKMILYLKKHYDKAEYELLKISFSESRNWSQACDWLENYYGERP